MDRRREQAYAKNGQFIIGIDEAGRGPLAGPVVCAAAMVPLGKDDNTIQTLIDDSKAMSEIARETSYEIIVKHPGILYGVSIVSHTEIDNINILQATLQGMKRATESLLEQINKYDESKYLALVDGNKVPKDMPVESISIIKGDSFIYSISVASIIAKVTRDRIMREYDTVYPLYNFIQHKGYPTLYHRMKLLEIGPCPIHRLTYGPVKLAKERHNIQSIFSNATAHSTLATSSTVYEQNLLNRKRSRNQRLDTTAVEVRVLDAATATTKGCVKRHEVTWDLNCPVPLAPPLSSQVITRRLNAVKSAVAFHSIRTESVDLVVFKVKKKEIAKSTADPTSILRRSNRLKDLNLELNTQP